MIQNVSMLLTVPGCSLRMIMHGEFDSFICGTALEAAIESSYLQLS